jgi:sialic acid synthase SpsE
MKRIKDKLKNDFYILAETAFSHEGNIEYLKKQIKSAKLGKADGIKFQILLDKDDSYSKNYDVYNLFDEWMLTKKEWEEIFQYAKKQELEIVVLPIDQSSLEFCIKNINKIDVIELHSINFNHYNFLKLLSTIEIPIILGVGGRTLDDIKYCLDFLGNNQDIIMMHGFQSFPTNYKELKLSRISKYKNLFDYIIGYADHTSYEDEFGIELIRYAYLNGARVFEKHLVLEKGKERVDYEAAVEKDDLLNIRKHLEELKEIQSDKTSLDFTKNEENYKNREKQIVTIRDVDKNEIFNKKNIGFRVNANYSDFQQRDYKKIIGKRATKIVKKDTVLKFSHIKNT